MAEPQTYRVKLSDGREFDVATEGGPPSEADILGSLGNQKTPEQSAPPFVPKTAKEWIDRLSAAAVDMPIGMVKGAARIGQSVPGVSWATDKAFGLPSGASVKATEPSNVNQKVGTYLNDVAILAATGGAEAGAPVMNKAVGYISNPTVADQIANGAHTASEFSGATFNAIKAELMSGGGPTPEKVASLAVKFGKKAVQAALIGAGLGGGYGALRHLF